jgi:hypothetical protein
MRERALVAADSDGVHILQAEVPGQVRVQEGRHEAADGRVHQNRHLPAVLAIEVLCAQARRHHMVK